jgi:ABC-type Na+ efflux pump permease subunit
VFKKEIKDTIVIFAQTLLILFVIPIVLMMDWQISHSQWELSNIFHFVFMSQVIIFAAYSGVSIFQKEKSDRALEYMFSLPMSRWEILFAKIIPRFTLLVTMVLVGGVFGVWEQFIADLINIILVFVLAVCISLAVESMINAIIGVMFLNIIIYYASLILSFVMVKYHLFGLDIPLGWLSQLLATFLLVVPMVVAFTKTLKAFDFKPLKWQGKSYLLIALPSVIVLMVFILNFLKRYLHWVQDIG